MPVNDDYGDDSLRVIVQRDLDYSDRMNVIALDRSTLDGLMPPAGGKSTFLSFAKFGAALLLQNDTDHPGPSRRGLRRLSRTAACSPSIFFSTAVIVTGDSSCTESPTRSSSGSSESGESRKPVSPTSPTAS